MNTKSNFNDGWSYELSAAKQLVNGYNAKLKRNFPTKDILLHAEFSLSAGLCEGAGWTLGKRLHTGITPSEGAKFAQALQKSP